MLKNTPIYICVIAGLVLMLSITSCSKYSRLLKSTDIEAKYGAAMKYFEKKDYFRALQIGRAHV